MKITINLIPPEIQETELKKANFYKIQYVGIATVLMMVFLASLTGALRILQSRSVTAVQAKLTQTEQRVSDLKNTQASLLLLKNRLAVISKYWGVPSEQSSAYQLINTLIPPSVVINSIIVDRSGGVALLALAPDSVVLDNLVSSLTAKENNEGKISKVSIESLNRGRDGFYRISFKIKPR